VSPKKIIIGLIFVFIVVATIIIYNAFGFKRKFTILTLKEFNVCFMVNQELSYELTPNGFKYWGGKNSGEFNFKTKGFLEGVNYVDINGFKAAYKKEKNLRIYQYDISSDQNSVIITDHFVYASKSPLNLVPYRDDCDKIRAKHKDQVELTIPQ